MEPQEKDEIKVIPQKEQELSEQIESVTQLVSTLENVISSALRPEDSEPEPKGKEEVPEAILSSIPLAQNLERHKQSLQGVYDKMKSIIDRVEL